MFSVSFSPDTPLTIAAAGSAAKLQIWDLSANSGVRKAFGQRLKKAGRELKEEKKSDSGGLIGVMSDDEDDEDEDME